MAKNNDFHLTLGDLPHTKQEYLETIFALSNGHFGIRAGHPLKTLSAYPCNPGLFINGFYESEPIIYGEWAFGYAKDHETICKLPNIRGVEIKISDEISCTGDWQVNLLSSELNMFEGYLTETYQMSTPQHKVFSFEIQSFASMVEKEIYACAYRLVEKNFSEPITLKRVFKDSSKIVTENFDPV